MSQEQLLEYYQFLYPFDTLTKWLTYNGAVPLIYRELSFQYDGGIVQRYVTFADAQKWKEKMAKNYGDIPRKVDVGAVFSSRPQKDKKQIKPQQRQFIFDFDINDYDDVRTCCQGKKICEKCWKLMKVAITILKTALNQDYGFTKLMYVFSGGRGLHIWVCDKQARQMKDSTRKAVVDYLQLVTGSEKAQSPLAENVLPSKAVNIFYDKGQKNQKDRQKVKQQMHKLLHPHIQRSLSIINKVFLEIFYQQKSLENEKARQLVTKIINNRSKVLKQRIENRWKNRMNRQGWEKVQNKTAELYADLLEQVSIYQTTLTDQEYVKTKSMQNGFRRYAYIEEEIQLTFLYPRMDYNVSTMRNHLLKLPFSVHPTSRKISVPMFQHQVDTFDPYNCITIDQLLDELTKLKGQNDFSLQFKSNEEIANVTLLRQFVRPLQIFCEQL